MNRFAITVAGASAFAAVGLGLSATAAAAGGADVTINGLNADGYVVQINGPQSAPLTACTVTNISKEPAGGHSPTAFVDLTCPDGC